MFIEIDIPNNKYKITKEKSDTIGNNFSNSRIETYGYFDKYKRFLCNLIIIINKDLGIIQEKIIGYNENYERYVFDYIRTLEYINYNADFIAEYRPPLIYNFDLVVKGIKRNKNVYIVEDERFANYLCNKKFIATTILDGLDRDIDIRFLKTFKNANIFFIGKSSKSNIDQKIKSIANKVRILNNSADYRKEFGKDSELLKVVREYDIYLDTLKEKDLLVDSNIYNSYKNGKEPNIIRFN